MQFVDGKRSNFTRHKIVTSQYKLDICTSTKVVVKYVTVMKENMILMRQKDDDEDGLSLDYNSITANSQYMFLDNFLYAGESSYPQSYVWM